MRNEWMAHWNTNGEWRGMAHIDSAQRLVRLNPAHYTPNPRTMRTLVDYLYDALGVSRHRPFRRIAVAIACGGLLFVIGLLLAIPIGFLHAYATSPGTYFVVFSFMFFLDRWRSVTEQLIPISVHVRDVFTVSDEEYAKTLNTIGQRATNISIVVPLTVVAIAIGCAFIAAMDFIPGSLPALYTAQFPYPFSPAWFSGPGLALKMIISDLLTIASMVVVVPITYATLIGLPSLMLAIRKWDVISVPAHVALRMNRVVQFFLVGGLYYAVGVTIALFATGGDRDPLIIAVTITLTIVGLASVLTPVALTSQLITRSQQCLATAIGKAYYNAGNTLSDDADIAAESLMQHEPTSRVERNFEQLREFQETLDAALKTKGVIGQLGAIGVAIVTQSLPLLHLVIPATPR